MSYESLDIGPFKTSINLKKQTKKHIHLEIAKSHPIKQCIPFPGKSYELPTAQTEEELKMLKIFQV